MMMGAFVTSVSYSAASVAASGKIPVKAMPIQLDIQMLSAVETRLRMVKPRSDSSKVVPYEGKLGKMPKNTGNKSVASQPAHASQKRARRCCLRPSASRSAGQSQKRSSIVRKEIVGEEIVGD